MTQRRGLTWSKKWHIVDDTKSDDRYDVAKCGAYLYNAEKERAAWRGAKMPEHLQQIIDGKRKDAGTCKLCLKSAGATDDLGDALAEYKQAMAEYLETEADAKQALSAAEKALTEALKLMGRKL